MRQIEYNEVWKDIEGYEGIYQVGSNGNVISLNYNSTKNKKNLKKVINNHGYYRLCLFGNKIKQVVVHRLVAQAFIPNPNNLSDVNHINGIKTDNRVENLEWCTRAENIKHAVSKKLHNYGEKHGMAVLTEKKVLQIRKIYSLGLKSQRKLAFEYGVSRGCITGIIKKIKWKHI